MRRRTRKWALLAQEATRLAELGLEPKEIAARLGVDRSSVTRWMASGKLPRPARAALLKPDEPTAPRKSPADWAAAVRDAYALDATDEQLVTMAEAALRTAQDATELAGVRLSAMGRFQALVKQLALVARLASDEIVPSRPPPKPAAPRPRSADPRTHLMAVK